MRSYTAEELETQTGIDRRTIAYYIQQGLLPRVGRRGPRTRYPGYVRDRLLFIRRVREAEEAGEIEPMTLSDLRELFEQAHPELIARVADERLSAAYALEVAAAQTHVHANRPPAARFLARERAFRAMSPEFASGLDRATASRRLSVSRFEAGADRETGADQQIEVDRTEGPGRIAGPAEADEPNEPGDDIPVSGPDGSDPPLSEGIARTLSAELSELEFRAQDRRDHTPGLADRWMRVKISPHIALSVRSITDEDMPLLESAIKQLRRLVDGLGRPRNRQAGGESAPSRQRNR